MELIVCFGFAVSAFVLLIVGIVGLVSAPTPILLSILVVGVMLTQKSIDKLNEPLTSIVEEKDRDTIEKVVEQDRIAVTPDTETEVIKTMVYRGSNYKVNSYNEKNIGLPSNLNSKLTKARAKVVIQYRGVKSEADTNTNKAI